MRFLLPPGIGDSVWALHKIQGVAEKIGDGRVEVYLCGGPSELQSRAIDFVRRFDFVEQVEMRPYDIGAVPAVSPEGYYNYIEDGWHEFPVNNGWKTDRCCALMPNGPLERGVRLENWLPQYAIDWDLFKHFRISGTEWELAGRVKDALGKYAVFYLGPLRGNTVDGHNRGPLWKPQDWLALGRRIRQELGLRIVVVGASYDASYFEDVLFPLLDGDFGFWSNLIGKTNIGQLFAVTSLAQFVVSYQAGVGIVSGYLGVPTAMWWRPKGDSISPSRYLSFEESMSTDWISPDMQNKDTYLPLIYTKHGIDYMMNQFRRKGWA